MTRIILLGAVSVLTIAACAPTAESVQGPDQNRFAQGAAIGALTGAALGVATSDDGNDDRERAIAGAAIGAAIGAGLGGRLDQQEQALRQQLQGPGIGIVNTGQDIRVTFPNGLLFAVDSASVSAASQADLRALAANLQQYPSRVTIIGHTDDTGSEAYNLDLSQRRAQAVGAVLVAAGVPQGIISVTGRGESAPIASNATPEGRTQNRRVEVILTPIQ